MNTTDLSPQALKGLKVVLNPLLVLSTVEVRFRPWWERLFTRPWRPLVHFEKHTVHVPDPNGYVERGTIFVHPETWARFQEEATRGNT